MRSESMDRRADSARLLDHFSAISRTHAGAADLVKRFGPRLVALIALSAAAALPIAADGLEDVSFHVVPGFELPLGPKSAVTDANGLYKPGGSAALRAQYVFPGLPVLYLDGGFTYNIQPTQADVLSLIAAGLGTGINLRVGRAMSLNAGAEAGMYLGLYPGEGVAGNPYVTGRASLSVDFSPTFTLSAGAGYKYYLGYDQENGVYTDLYQGLSATIGTVFRIDSGSERTKMKVEDITMDPVFPVFYTYYDSNSLGRVTIRNEENSPVSDVKVYFNVPQYMDQPRLCATLPGLSRGGETEVELNALFLNSILQLTEPAKASAEVIVEYTYLGKQFTRKTPFTLRIHDRNSMTWDDDRKAASFITPRDPTVLLFSKNVISILRDYDSSPINQNFRTAIGIFETLKLYGMNYAIDPNSSYIELSGNAAAIDFLQFPSQTLTYRAGDCDDLSILYTALLESVNISTAFITIPGHIYMAFSLGLDEQEASKEFTHTEDFIFMENSDGVTEAWVPVEITLVTDGFTHAWETGARQWRDASAKGQAAFYPIRSAWEHYEPVSISGTALPLLFPSTDEILASYKEDIGTFVEHEVKEKADAYFARIQERGDNPKIRNRIGILYARNGMYDDAAEQFRLAAEQDESYTAPMINLGNIYFLNRNYAEALSWYENASKTDADNAVVLAGLARSRYELGQFEQAREDYERLAAVSPETAAQYSYLGQASETYARASAARDKGKTLWDDEEDVLGK